MAGFSVGELTALIAAEALPLEKGMYVCMYVYMYVSMYVYM